MRALAHFGGEVGLDVRTEPRESRHVVNSVELRPDIRSYGFKAMGDVAVVYPCAKLYVREAAQRKGAACVAKEGEKVRKYQECARREGVPFFPLILETFGLPGEGLVNFVDGLIKARALLPPEVAAPAALKPRINRVLSFTLQRGNAEAILEGLSLVMHTR